MTPTRTILIIEDNEIIRQSLQDYLQQLGYQVITAEDGLGGMDKIKEEKYDLLLLDIRLPYISGIGLVKIAKEIRPDIPVICMTGYGISPGKIAKEENVNEVFSKPFELKELAKSIEKYLVITK